MDFNRQVLNILGYRGNDGDTQTLNDISQAEKELTEVCGEIKSVTGIWDCRVYPETVIFNGFTIKSISLAKHMAGAEYISLFAVTLGAQADFLINKYMATDMRRAVITDAVASVMVNEHCRKICTEISALPAVKNLRQTKRFSPGFGDFGLENQQGILDMLNASKSIGITLTAGNMMMPLKSVTAAVGFI